MPAAHHRLVISELEKVERGEVDRLMILMPPGSAKSTYGSKLFPGWFLSRKPDRRILACSHTADYAVDIGGESRDFVRDNAFMLGMGLLDPNVGKGKWRSSNNGFYVSAGVGGTIAGRRADLAIIDDPVKSREDAESEVIQARNWAWFTGDLRTRLKPGARIVLIMTRWHMNDLGGMLLQTQADRWRIIKLPAQAIEGDPLGRSVGEFLWSDDEYGYGADIAAAKREYEANGAMRDWWSLYEQEPRPAEGSLFKVGNIPILPAAPIGGTIVRAWDLAATEQVGTRDPDWTVGVKMMRRNDGTIVVLDVVRFRGEPQDVEAIIKLTKDLDGRGVRIGMPQDPGQAGKAQIKYLTKQLMGAAIESSPETGDKATRASPFASQVNVGNVSLVAGAWNTAYINELRDFPSGSKDDQVDASSRAFDMLTGTRTRMRINPEATARLAVSEATAPGRARMQINGASARRRAIST